MDKRIIYHIVFASVIAVIYYLFFDGTTLIQAVTFAVVYVILSFLLDLIMDKRKAKLNREQVVAVDEKEVLALIAAVGGTGNIESADSESARVRIVIKDVDLINQSQLEALALEGAFLSGNQLQITIGTNSSAFAQKIASSLG